jgi:dihydroorotate dehydrogenase subfamily 2
MKATDFFASSYQKVLKPLLFQFDAEAIHDLMTNAGELLGDFPITRQATHRLFAYEHEALSQVIDGTPFKNPIGLSAGFDYNARLTSILPSVGFGFASVGTVTRKYYEGNPKPRLGRLPKSKSLLVNKGFKSLGIERVLNNHVKLVDAGFQAGISIGATNSPQTATTETQIEDIVSSFSYLKNHKRSLDFSYYEVNISCPNVRGSGNLASPQSLTTVLTELASLKLKKPLWVKFPIEQSFEESKPLLKIMIDKGVQAVVIGNLAKSRSNSALQLDELKTIEHAKGNFSGKPTWELSNALIKHTYKTFGNDIKIVGVGGVFSAADAYQKITLGASLVQLITGMIFMGPQLIGQINKGLVEQLHQDGLEHISEAIGSRA